jgi:hypothetical protein
MPVVARRFGAVLLIAAALVSDGGPAHAACAYDPDSISFRRMILRGTTGDDYFHRMIIGRVAAIRDPGAQGGDATAVVAVAAHPTGFVPLIARVRFWLPPPGTGLSENLEFAVGHRYVIIARHGHDGTYTFDGACGQTRSVSLKRFRALLALDRRTS